MLAGLSQVYASLPSFLLPFFTLSYPTDPPANPDSFPNASYYHRGLKDGWLLLTLVAVMAIVRDCVRLGLLEPFARWKLKRDLRKRRLRRAQVGKEKTYNGDGSQQNGHSSAEEALAEFTEKTPLTATSSERRIDNKEEKKLHRSVLRFAEQGYSFIYYGFSWCFGMYVHTMLPTEVANLTYLWLGYPHMPLAGPVKLFYLTQAAFYVHQILILNAEARRKDHWQMMTHHVITVALVVASYFYNFNRVGCMVMVIMDWCDIFLPLAKMFRYLDMSTYCDVTFVFFMVSWFVTRHVLFISVIKSAYYDAPVLIGFDWVPERGHFLTRGVYIGCISMLCALQVLQVLWSRTICRVAWHAIKGSGAQDERSDDEFEEKKDR